MNYSDRPWLKYYEELGKPVTAEPYPDGPLYELLYDAAGKNPDSVACVFRNNEITYGELVSQADSLAAFLASEMNVKKGDRVATILPTSPQFIIADIAILKCGAVVVPCSFLHREGDLVYELGEAGVKTIICLDTSLEIVRKVSEKIDMKNIIITSIDDYSSEQQTVVMHEGTFFMRDVIDKNTAGTPVVGIDPGNDLALLPFTGGSTGIPKGVMLSHLNMQANVHQTLTGSMGVLRGIKDLTMMMALPFFHQYGHMMMYASIGLGARMLLVPDARDTDEIVGLMKRYKPLLTIGVPTQYMKIINKDLGGISTIGVSGSAPLPPEVADEYEKKTKSPLGEGYGLTETSPTTHVNISRFYKLKSLGEKPKAGSIGIPLLDTDIRLVDPINGKDVPFGEVGEMLIRGPQLMVGYWPTPGNGLDNGWLHTGDLVRMDEDYFFFVVDRIKDMINISGMKVYSRVVDDVLFEHPAVEVAGVIGIPDPDIPGSERIKAFIKLGEKFRGNVTEDDIISFCKEKLPPYAVPKFIEFRDELPLTVTEKLFKRKLREEEIEKMKK